MKICPACSKPELSINSVAVCSACGWQSRNVDGVQDFLTDDQRGDAQSQDYIDSYERLAQKNLVKSNLDRSFLREIASSLARNLDRVEGLKICDVGIGQGYLCDILLERGAAHVTAIDVAASYLKRFAGRDRIEPYLANAETLPFANEFDVVVTTDVIEHVQNVGSFLFSLNRALKPGGTAVIRTPYREGLLGYSPHMGCEYRFAHLRSFNKDIVKVYLKEAGFEITSMRFDAYSPQMPRPWIMKWKVGQLFMMAFHHYVAKRFKHWSEVNRLPASLLFAFLRPNTIVVTAKKVKELGRQA